MMQEQRVQYFQEFRTFTGDMAELRQLLLARGLPASAADLCMNPTRSSEFDAFFHDEMQRIVRHFNQTTKSNVKVPIQSAVLPPPPPIITPARFVSAQQAQEMQQDMSSVQTGHSASGRVQDEVPVFLTPPEFDGFIGISPSNTSDASPLFACH